MTHDDKQWVVDSIKIGLAESRRELLEKDVPVLIGWHLAGCPIGKKMCVLLGGIAVIQVVLAATVAMAVKLL